MTLQVCQNDVMITRCKNIFGKSSDFSKKGTKGRQKVRFLKGLWPRSLVQSFIATACSFKILVNLSLEFLINLSAEVFDKVM